MTVSKSTSGEAHYLKTTPVTTSFTFEYTWVNGANQLFNIRATDNLESETWFIWYCLFSNQYIGMGMTGLGTTDSYYGGMVKGDKVKLVVTPTSAKGYVNDKLCVTRTGTVPSQLYLGLYTNQGRSQTIKDLKIKPYTEE